MYRGDHLIHSIHTFLLFQSHRSNQKMAMSNEAIISLLGVIVNLPPALFVLWRLYVRRRQGGVNEAGLSPSHRMTSKQILVSHQPPSPTQASPLRCMANHAAI